MAYVAPFIDAAGLHLNSFDDYQEYLQNNFASIYGQSVTTDISASDVQFLALIALIASDDQNTLRLVANGMGPATAVSTQQDLLYELNGLDRLEATFSTVPVLISGTPGTVITNGALLDSAGNLWSLPASVTIGGGGTVTVTATCSVLGAISLAIGAFTASSIATPTSGWTGASNSASASLGLPVEIDSNFRARQAVSVALPSRSLVSGTLAAIAAVPNVTRYAIGIPAPNGLSTSIENPTGGTDYFGNPAHSITMVVEGGTDLAVATAIYLNKTPGCLTNGTTEVTVNDPTTGVPIDIGFYRPTLQNIYSTLSIHPLTGYTSATTNAIQVAVTAYLNSLQIGEAVLISALYSAANSVMPNLSTPIFSIFALVAGASFGGQGTTDIPISSTAVSLGVLVNCVINLV